MAYNSWNKNQESDFVPINRAIACFYRKKDLFAQKMCAQLVGKGGGINYWWLGW